MAAVTTNNVDYFIRQSALVLTENAVATTDGTDHRYIAASLSSGTRMAVRDGLSVPEWYPESAPVPDASASGSGSGSGSGDPSPQLIPLTFLAADLGYDKWSLRAYNTVLSPDYDSLEVYVYARLNLSDRSDGLVIYSPNDYDLIGRRLTYDEEGNPHSTDTLHPTDATHIYIKIGVLTAPDEDTNLRSLSYDTGCLDTVKGDQETKDEEWRKMFLLVSDKIQPQKWFEKVETYLFSMFGPDGKVVRTVSRIIDTLQDIPEPPQPPTPVPDDSSSGSGSGSGSGEDPERDKIIAFLKSSFPSAYAVVTYIAAKLEALKDVFLSKVHDDTAAGRIVFAHGIETHDYTDRSSGSGSGDGEFRPSVDAETVVGDVFHVDVQAEFGDDFQKGIQGARIYKTEGGQWKGEFDYLKVHRKFEVEELEVMHTSHIGGKLMQTAANMTVSEVWAVADVNGEDVPFLRNAGNGPEKLDEDLYDAYVNDRSVATKYVCLFVTKDGEKIIDNKWQKNDQAYCESFNLNGFTDDTGNTVLGNHFFWRKVVAVEYPAYGNAVRGYLHEGNFYSDADHTLLVQPSSDESYFDIPTSTYYIWNGQQGFTPGIHTVFCVVLSNLDTTDEEGHPTDKADFSDAPVPGDEVVQLGNQDADFGHRQGAIVLAAADNDEVVTPYIQLYRGINSFTMPEPFIRLAPDNTWIKANDIFIGDSGKEESVKTILDGLTDGEFLIWQLSASAPASADDIHWNSTAVQGLPSTAWVTETDRDLHVGDVIIFTGGETYRFLKKNDSWYWCIFSDKYLIDTTNTLRNIFADNKVTPDEKKELRKTYDDLKTTYEDLLARTQGPDKELTAAEFAEIEDAWDEYAGKYSLVESFLRVYILNDMTTTSDITSDRRSHLATDIAELYLYSQTLAQLIRDVQLQSTGWHKEERKIVVTADSFEIRNLEDEKTLYLNDSGDLNIKGVLNRNAIVIKSGNAEKFLIPFNSDDFVGNKNFADYKVLDNIGTRQYNNVSVVTFNPFDSHDLFCYADAEIDHSHSLDVLRLDGIVVLERSLIDKKSGDAYHSWITDSDPQVFKNLLVLPYMRFCGSEGSGTETEYIFQCLRTPTRNNTGNLHLITLNEMRGLVGKRITICNAVTNVWVLGFSGVHSEEENIWGVVDNVSQSVGIPTVTSEYGGADGDGILVSLPYGMSITLEYREIIRRIGNNQVSDIVPIIVSSSTLAQQFSHDAIVRQPTFGDDNYGV